MIGLVLLHQSSVLDIVDHFLLPLPPETLWFSQFFSWLTDHHYYSPLWNSPYLLTIQYQSDLQPLDRFSHLSTPKCLKGVSKFNTELLIFLPVLPNLIEWQPDPSNCWGQNENLVAPWSPLSFSYSTANPSRNGVIFTFDKFQLWSCFLLSRHCGCPDLSFIASSDSHGHGPL